MTRTGDNGIITNLASRTSKDRSMYTIQPPLLALKDFLESTVVITSPSLVGEVTDVLRKQGIEASVDEVVSRTGAPWTTIDRSSQVCSTACQV